MRDLLITIIIGGLLIIQLDAQNIAITDDNAYTANTSAMLDVKSITKGMLVPRMTSVQRTSIVSPATGLLVFDTNENVFYYYTGTVWTNMSTGQLWSKNGNYVYLTNTDENVGIGVTAPDNKLLVKADATTGIDESIFAVLNNNGDTVFAVYQEGVRIWVNDAGGTKANGSRGGFAVGGFSPTKLGVTNEYLRVTPDSVRIYIDDSYIPAKANGSRGGFAVGGFNPAKGTPTDNYLFVQDDSTRVWTNGAGGFEIQDLATGSSNYLDLTPDNYFIGHQSGTNNTTGLYNSFFGFQSGSLNNSGNKNVFMGYRSGSSNTIGDENIFIGNEAGFNNIDGSGNTFIGDSAGFKNVSGWRNVFIGNWAGQNSMSAHNNAFIGTGAGRYNEGANNTYLGNSAGFLNQLGHDNVAIGLLALSYNQGGSYNTCFGSFAGSGGNNYLPTLNNNDVFVGYKSGFNALNDSNNTYIGTYSGHSSQNGYGNVFLGFKSGYYETGSNKLYIDNSPTSLPLIYGDFAANYLRINGYLNINGAYTFPVVDGTNNQVLITNGAGTVSWTSSSTLYDDDWVVSGTNMYSGVTGNVGIGTTLPSQKLSVAGNIELSQSLYFTSGNFYIYNGNSRKVLDSWWSGGLGTTGLNVGDYTAINSAYDWTADEPSSIITSNSYPFLVTIGSSTNPGVAYQSALMLMTNVGDLGVGTTTPTSKVHAVDDQAANDSPAVYGSHAVTDYYGVGVQGVGRYRGVVGTATSASGASVVGVYGSASGVGTGNRYGIFGTASGGATAYAGYFQGNVNITGTLSKGGGSFKIDHPLDPENKYLYHSFVESPDMMNIYNGVVTLGANGEATVVLPDWFEALNNQYRYQLTAIGGAAPNLHISKEISGNQFSISGGVSGMKISWEVTGIRKDPFAEKNRIPVEVEKTEEDKGFYLYPELYGMPKNKAIDFKNIKH